MATLNSMEVFLTLWLDDYARELKIHTEKNGSAKGFHWDDQMALRRLHKRLHPRVKVDTLSKVFTRRDERIAEL